MIPIQCAQCSHSTLCRGINRDTLGFQCIHCFPGVSRVSDPNGNQLTAPHYILIERCQLINDVFKIYTCQLRRPHYLDREAIYIGVISHRIHVHGNHISPWIEEGGDSDVKRIDRNFPGGHDVAYFLTRFRRRVGEGESIELAEIRGDDTFSTRDTGNGYTVPLEWRAVFENLG